MDLGALSQRPEAFERYTADKLREGFSQKTVRNQLVLLGLMFKMARRWRWISENPLELVEPPSIPDAETVPGMFVQAKAGHAQGSTTQRYHSHRTSYPDAAALAEARLFAEEVPSSPVGASSEENSLQNGLPGVDSNH
jgi:hypothetical protein